MKSSRTYTAAEKQSAIRRALVVGPGAASRELGIPSGTLSCWAHKARRGVAGFSVEPPPTVDEESSPTQDAEPTTEAPPTTESPSKRRVARLYTPSEKARALERAAKIGVTATCRELGMARFSIYEWRRKVRLAAEGKGDAPTSGPDPADIEAQRDKEILDIYKTHPGLGPSQIRNQLRRKGVKIGVNTVRRVMEEAGYRPPKVKREGHERRYEAVRPNHMWLMPSPGLCAARFR
ncbi:MAG: transposase [Actinomycetia bacterium]|nr:transposase [Actinomycetes bacterium]